MKKNTFLNKKAKSIIASAMAMTLAVPSVTVLVNETEIMAEEPDSIMTTAVADSNDQFVTVPQPVSSVDFEVSGIGVEADADRGNVFHYTSDECELVLDNPYGSEELAEYLRERSEYDVADDTWKRFGGKLQPVWEKGLTLSYWIKVPADENGEYFNSSILRWELYDQEYYQADDYAKYLCCTYFDVEKTADYLNYTAEDYATAAKEESKVIYGSEFYFKYLEYATDENGNVITDASGAPVAAMYKGTEGIEGPVYDVRYFEDEKSWYYMYNPHFTRGYVKTADGRYELQLAQLHCVGDNENYYSRYSTVDIDEGSYIRRALVDGELQIDADDSILWIADGGDGIQSNPNSVKDYGTIMSMQGGNMFFMNSWRESVEEVTGAGGTYQSAKYSALSPVTSITDYNQKDGSYTGVKDGNCDTWHQVTVTLQNDWAEFYVDGIKADIDENYSSYGRVSIGSGTSFERLNKGTGLRSSYGSDVSRGRFSYGNYVCRLLMEWITDEEATFHIGGSGKYGKEYNLAGESTEFYLDDLKFYGELLDEKQIQAAYEAQKPIEDVTSGGVDVGQPGNNKPVDDNKLVGDVDGNGKLELNDAQIVLRAALKISGLTQIQIQAADIDTDNQITLTDAQKILKLALKIIE